MQQINLYQPILRKQERIFSLKTLLQGNLLILAILVLIYGVTLYQTHTLRSQHAQLLQQRLERTEHLADIQKKFQPVAQDPNLDAAIDEKQALLNHRMRLLNELRHQNTGADGNPGFSEQLSGLARQDARNIWLQQISLRDGKQLTLRGMATDAREVPQFIQRLTNEPSFNGTTFTQVQITRDEGNKNVIGFVLETSDDEKSGGDAE